MLVVYHSENECLRQQHPQCLPETVSFRVKSRNHQARLRLETDQGPTPDSLDGLRHARGSVTRGGAPQERDCAI